MQHLVQQIGMAMLRQYRLWEAEAAIANHQLLPSEPYPIRRHDDEEAVLAVTLGRPTEYHPKSWRQERAILEEVLIDLNSGDFPSRDSVHFEIDWPLWQEAMDDLLAWSLKSYRQHCAVPEGAPNDPRSPWVQMHQWPSGAAYDDIAARISPLRQACEQRLRTIAAIEAAPGRTQGDRADSEDAAPEQRSVDALRAAHSKALGAGDRAA